MMESRTHQPQSIGSLFSGNIFGNQAHVPVSLKTKPKTKNVPATRTEKVTFTQLTENVNPVISVYPYINAAAFAATMDNYRLYVAAYNDMVKDINIEIDKYNAAVRTLRASGELNQVQIQFSEIFLEKNNHKETKEYNELVD
jgi:hypothetical protein